MSHSSLPGAWRQVTCRYRQDLPQIAVSNLLVIEGSPPHRTHGMPAPNEPETRLSCTLAVPHLMDKRRDHLGYAEPDLVHPHSVCLVHVIGSNLGDSNRIPRILRGCAPRGYDYARREARPLRCYFVHNVSEEKACDL